jgi:hypothetical protein
MPARFGIRGTLERFPRRCVPFYLKVWSGAFWGNITVSFAPVALASRPAVLAASTPAACVCAGQEA